MNQRFLSLAFTCAIGTITALPVAAEIKVGISISTSGAGAYFGTQHLQAIELFPSEIAGETISWIVLNEESDPTLSTRNARRFVTQDGVDVLVGGTLTPSAIAMSFVAAETGTPYLAPAPFLPGPDAFSWTFVTAQDSTLMAQPLFELMRDLDLASVAFLGFNDAFGDPWEAALEAFAAEEEMDLVAVEHFARTDASIAGQALKIVSAQPDAVLVGASGPAAAMAQVALRERGFEGPVMHTHGAAAPVFISTGGEAVEGAFVTSGPLTIFDELPVDHPSYTVVTTFAKSYAEAFGEPPSTFAGYMYDIALLLEAAIPVALEEAAPGSPEFRSALRDALEGLQGIPGVQGVYNISAEDHAGHDVSSMVLLTVVDGAFVLAR